MIKNQKKGIICILLVVSFFMILSYSYAAPLKQEQFNQDAVENTIDGDEIILIGGEEYILLKEITINKAITIKSNDSTQNAVINLKNNARAFNIAVNGNLTLINITIINGKSFNGGAIYNNGTLTVSGSTFTNNQAIYDGGAIYNYYGALTVSSSTFTNNQANYFGGTINNFGGVLTVSSSTFTNNQGSIGGAIYNDGVASYTGGVASYYFGVITVTDSTFNNNQAYDWGGAIYNRGTSTVSGSTFSNNKADRNGGAIYNTFGTLTVSGSVFINNQANIGSAIYNLDSISFNEIGTVTVSFSVFYNNTGDKVIYSIDYENLPYREDNVNLTDNFYFIPTITDLNELLDDFTNQPDTVHGLYYFEVSHGSVSYDGETLYFDFLSYYGDNQPSINQLPDLNISLFHNGKLINGFNYKTGVKLDGLADFEFSFFGIDFGPFNKNVEEKNQVDDDLVSGLPVDPIHPENLDEDFSKNGTVENKTNKDKTVEDEFINEKTGSHEDNYLDKNNNPNNNNLDNNLKNNPNNNNYPNTNNLKNNPKNNSNDNSNNPIKKVTNSYAFANVVYAASSEVNENNESKLNKSVGNPDKSSGKVNDSWNLGFVLIAIFLVLVVIAIAFSQKKKN